MVHRPGTRETRDGVLRGQGCVRATLRHTQDTREAAGCAEQGRVLVTESLPPPALGCFPQGADLHLLLPHTDTRTHRCTVALYTRTYTESHARTHTRTHREMHAHRDTHTHRDARTHTDTCTHRCIVALYTRAHTDACTHRHTHVHACARAQSAGGFCSRPDASRRWALG